MWDPFTRNSQRSLVRKPDGKSNVRKIDLTLSLVDRINFFFSEKTGHRCDAFVFGRRASKLRLKKVSQLIHNSAFHPDCKKCAVSVYFQEIVDREGNEDGFDIVPDSKFVVTREAFKDNKSHYIIDSKKSNFTDVTTLLKRKGIDLDNNRFLILQGEVEQISLMKPKAQNQYDVGMLEYLEDIIGSNMYVEPIEEAAGKVKQFEDERLLVLQKAVALEKARDELEGSKTEAEEFLARGETALSFECDSCSTSSSQGQGRFEMCGFENSRLGSET